MPTYLILKATNMQTADYDIPCCYFEYTSMKYNERLIYHLFHSKRNHPTKTIHKAIRAIGTHIWKWEIIDQTNNEEEAKEIVKYWIHEYQSDTIGYNDMKDESMNLNPDDHRTWEEKAGKERAEQMRIEQSARFKGMSLLSEQMKARLSVWNPMSDPEIRKKVANPGVSNGGTIYDYIFKKDDVEFVVPCLREFCRANPEFTSSGIRYALLEKRKYKGWSIKRVYKKDKI
jgi:hypothetical protein